MSECAGLGCDHPEHIHAVRVMPLGLVRVKTDGEGKWMTADDPRLGNRSQRRQMAREARRRTA